MHWLSMWVLFAGCATLLAKAPVGLKSELFEDTILKASDQLNTEGGSKYEEKRTSFKKSLQESKEKLISFGKNEKIAEGINGVGEGLTQLVTGVSSGSWQDMLLGGLSIVGTLASLAGPLGAALSTILGLVSMVFGLFGASQQAEESQEGMLKRVIDEALTRARADELKSEAEGLKKSISSIRNSINQFREENSINENQAAELYNQAFRGLNFFGQLKYSIDKYCDCSVESPSDEEKVKKAREDASRCLEFINLYADLSILRQLLIADMASLVGSVGLKGTAINLLSLTDKEKASDKEIILFLLDPIIYKAQRFCITQYFGAPNKYPILQAYLASISLSAGGKLINKHAVICSENELLGQCYKLEPNSYNKEQLQDWSDSIKSLFISKGVAVSAFSENEFKGVSYGLFTGPTVIGVTSGEWKSLKISESKNDASHYVRVCEKEMLAQDGRCEELKVKNYPDLKIVSELSGDIMTSKGKCVFPFVYKDKTYNECTMDAAEELWCAYVVDKENVMTEWEKCLFPQTWAEKITSISIPENVVVTLYTEENNKGLKFGPFYGSNVIDKLCNGLTTKSISIATTTRSSSEMVKICRGPSFTEMCDFMKIGSYPKLIINGCYYEKETNKIKSMRVPGGLAVYMWTDEGFKGRALGPYVGPVSVPLIDGGEYSKVDNNKSQVKSIIIREHPQRVDHSSKNRKLNIKRRKNML